MVCVISELGGPVPIPECLSSRVPQVLCELGTLVLGICLGIVCTIEVSVIFLNTLTLVFELYVRLREKRQRAETRVDTTSSQVDTRDLFQGTVLPVWDSVSTYLKGRSTHSGISVT
ncbi:hypothetical protein Taro_007644 [Colocasia esculenta]|uniref:Uncharacterized protein n=1 Tax=Colocasia esculenta TaxID=4460 RepID=A0A843TRU8_COLES|nr:hypothetical protein [Colocasia esculenta]